MCAAKANPTGKNRKYVSGIAIDRNESQCCKGFCAILTDFDLCMVNLNDK